MLRNSVRTLSGHLLPMKRPMRLLEVLAGGLISNMVSIRRSTYVKCREVLEYLTTRAMRILQVPARPCRPGSTPATRRGFLGLLPLIFPQHSWQLGVAGSFSWRVCCGLGLWIKNLGEDWPSGLVIVRRTIGKILECIPVMTSFSKPGGGCGPVVFVVFVRSPIIELVPGCD